MKIEITTYAWGLPTLNKIDIRAEEINRLSKELTRLLELLSQVDESRHEKLGIKFLNILARYHSPKTIKELKRLTGEVTNQIKLRQSAINPVIPLDSFQDKIRDWIREDVSRMLKESKFEEAIL